MRISVIILALLLSSYGVDRSTSLATGLQAYYPLTTPTENGKFAYDMHWNINQQDTMRGDAVQKYGGLMIDGSGDFVSCVHRSTHTITDRFTISVWVYPQTLVNTNKHVISKVNNTFTDNNYAILFDYSAAPNQFEFYAGGYTGTNPRTGTQMIISTANMWHHVCYSYNGSTFSCYLNGVLKASVTTTFSLATNGSFLSIGGNYQFGNQLNGRLRHFALWNRGLRAEEVRRLYLEPEILLPK